MNKWYIVQTFSGFEQKVMETLKENVKKNQEIEDSSKSNIGDMIKSEINEQKNEE